MIVLDKLDEDGMPITESVTTNEEEFEIVRDGKDFSVKFQTISKPKLKQFTQELELITDNVGT